MLPGPQLAAALSVVRCLRDHGHQAYFAGGCVRDLALGRIPADYDVATSATPDVVLGLFPRTYAVGAHFGVVLVAGEDGARTEVATFRADGAYSDGRHPDAVRYTLSAAEDVARRDFTVNGLLLDPWHGDGVLDALLAADGNGMLPAHKDRIRAYLVDHVGGLDDLKAGLIRAIGPAHTRFEEDHLRMMRAVRFAARLGFAIDEATGQAIARMAPCLAAVSRERVRDELTKMLTEGRARRAFELLHATGLLAQVLPEVAKMTGVEQPADFHPEGDVWQHTLLLLDQLEPGAPMTLGWGALLHDIGKPATFCRATDRIRFDGHVEVGVAIAADICRRFRFSKDETARILALIENHMRFMDVMRMREATLKRFFRLEDFDQHLQLHRMDCLASKGDLRNWEYARERWLATPAEAVRPQPLLTGKDLITAGYRPGPQFKVMLAAVEEAQLEGCIDSLQGALDLLTARFGVLLRP